MEQLYERRSFLLRSLIRELITRQDIECVKNVINKARKELKLCEYERLQVE